ncbi:MAG: outer membrane protein transport protein [Acidobacteria bacterium]|nr:outer membrane protein transport protein [Acidobacteriota bacterium]
MRNVSVAAIALAFAVPLVAQNTDIEALSGLQFDFANPGARALGMGGAFVAIADDASAAESNPAGLTVLREPEVSLELRKTTMSQLFATGGYYPDLPRTDFAATDVDVSFVSVVYPLERSSFALFYHSSLDLQNTIDTIGRYPTPTYFVGPDGAPLTFAACQTRGDCVEGQIYPYASSVDISLESFGLAAAHDFGNVSVGMAIRYSSFSEVASSHRIDTDLPGQPTFLITQQNGARLYGDETDDDITWVAGVKWQPSSAWSLGAVYKKGPEFPAPVFSRNISANSPAQLDLIGTTRFEIPDAASVGVAWHPTPNLLLGVDVARIDYSVATNDFLSVIEVVYDGDQLTKVEGVSGYEADDATEIHAGVEYYIQTRVPFAIRAGWWTDPAHAIAYRGPLVGHDAMSAEILFPETDDVSHYTLGVGLSWPRWQVDAAYDTSSLSDVASISVVMKF